MKLISRKVFPKNNNSLVFAVNNDRRIGFVGMMLFKDYKWYTMPDQSEFLGDFFWVELNDQPERSKREDSKCSCHITWNGQSRDAVL